MGSVDPYENTSGAGKHETMQAVGPTEYRCYIQEVVHQYATAGADYPPQAMPSSATQLSIMAALHAENLTLFVPILQEMDPIVKPLFAPFDIFVPIVQFDFLPDSKFPARKTKTNVL